jgi:hypothetical protein
LQAALSEVNRVMVRKWIQRGLLAGTALLAAAAIGPGCAEAESSLFIRHVVARQAPDCIAQAEPDGVFIGTGLIDVALRDEYQGSLLVGNQLVPRGSQELVRSETNRIALRTGTVRIEDVGGTVLGDFEVPITGFVDQSTGIEPGYGLASMPIIDSATVNKVRSTIAKGASKRLVAFIKITGQTLGGSEVSTGEFQFVVQACNGCLVQFPPEADDPTVDGVDCLAPTEAGNQNNNDLPCIVGQDQITDCRLCVGSSPACERP